MRWKTLKKTISETGVFNDETKFVLGLDIGSSMTTLAFWDVTRQSPELIDMSGGYGKPSVPTVLQYIPETKEWVFGEYALLNKGFFSDITINNMPDKLGLQEYYEVDGKNISVVVLLSKFIKEILDSCKNINPNSEVVGIVVATPSYMKDEAKEELQRAIVLAGYEKEFISFMSDRECVLRYNEFKNTPSVADTEKLLILDYGSKEFRGGVCEVRYGRTENKINVHSSISDSLLGIQNIDNDIKELVLKYYCAEKKCSPNSIDEQSRQQLESFAYQNKGLIFQNGIQDKPLKLYYNFAYPPFQKTITRNTRAALALPYEKKMKEAIKLMHEKTVSTTVSKEDITEVICMGGGFEMYWSRGIIESMFPESKVNFYKNGGGILAIGACIGAASQLGIIPYKEFEFTDRHVLKYDYGLKVIGVGNESADRFFSLAERNTFWWKQNKRHVFMLHAETEKEPVIEFYKKNAVGDEWELASLRLEGIPPRPSGTTRLAFETCFNDINHLCIQVTDEGFGEIFPKSGFKKMISIEVNGD